MEPGPRPHERTLYPAVEPFADGLVDAGDGNLLHWEECGDPAGQPALVLHGGPGSGCSPGMRRFFDPSTFRVVLPDQRGCGRSRPHASAPEADLSTNTTEHLLRDIERLRVDRGIDRWLVLGVSWGTTLGLAYAERHPDRVTGLVLAGVTLGRRSEVDWLYHDVGRFHPEAFEQFRAEVPPDARDGDLVAAYHALLEGPDPSARAAAARAWTAWDLLTASVDGSGAKATDAWPHPWNEPAFQLARARLCAHYFHHDLFLEDDQLLRDAGALHGLPGVLVNGRLDLQCPVGTAWELAQAWPDSELVIVEGAGHATSDAGMTAAILTAIDRLGR